MQSRLRLSPNEPDESINIGEWKGHVRWRWVVVDLLYMFCNQFVLLVCSLFSDVPRKTMSKAVVGFGVEVDH